MTHKRISYGDIGQLLEAEGFQATATKETHLRFDHAPSQAALILPRQRPTVVASTMDLHLVRRTLIDFGVMSEEDFDRWVADPKRYQAA